MARTLPLLVLVIVVVVVPPAAALRCYGCAPVDTSELNIAMRLALSRLPLCEHFRPGRPQERFIVNCPELSNACIKTDTVRMCSVSLRKRERCKENGHCTCLTDLCNAAPPTAAGAPLLLLMMPTLAALRQLW